MGKDEEQCGLLILVGAPRFIRLHEDKKIYIYSNRILSTVCQVVLRLSESPRLIIRRQRDLKTLLNGKVSAFLLRALIYVAPPHAQLVRRENSVAS